MNIFREEEMNSSILRSYARRDRSSLIHIMRSDRAFIMRRARDTFNDLSVDSSRVIDK